MKALILVMGMIGTGKTSLAQRLAREMDMVLISSDPLRKELAGLEPFQRVEEEFQAGLYSPQMTEKVYSTMAEKAREYLEKGKGVVLDATFSEKRWRDMALAVAREGGIPCLLVVTTAPERVVKERLEKRQKERVVSDGRWEIYLKHREKFQMPREEGSLLVLDTREDLDSLVKKVKEVLNGL